MQQSPFTILITTKNRLADLTYTLSQINYLFEDQGVACIICDDGSTDETSAFLKANYPNIHLIRNEKSKGLIYSRNNLLALTQTEYAISLDDDLHFITQNPLEIIENHFNQHPECGVIGFRIFWSKSSPTSTDTNEGPIRMKSFAGGAHAWRIKSWHQIPDYPAWFVFHGEEDFAAYQMFKKNIEIQYLPAVLVHHRVDIKQRKNDSDYTIRLRRSLRSGWYLYFLFFPIANIPRLFLYSIWMQLKTKVFKGDFRALRALLHALLDLIFAIPKLVQHANRLSIKEYAAYQKLENLKLYWKPKN